MTNYDQPITTATGVRTCANPTCAAPIGTEFVLQCSTRHVRWFCSDLCLVESGRHHLVEISRAVTP